MLGKSMTRLWSRSPCNKRASNLAIVTACCDHSRSSLSMRLSRSCKAPACALRSMVKDSGGATGQQRTAGAEPQLVGSGGTLSHHFVHGHPQPTGTDALTNRPYKPCCRRNEDEATRVGKGGKKSAGADQSVANASAESRENKMRTMMTGSYRGRQHCHRQRRG